MRRGVEQGGCFLSNGILLYLGGKVPNQFCSERHYLKYLELVGEVTPAKIPSDALGQFSSPLVSSQIFQCVPFQCKTIQG